MMGISLCTNAGWLNTMINESKVSYHGGGVD